MLGKNLCVTENNKAILSTSEGYIQATGIIEEADAGSFVASYAWKKDEVFLSPLEAIYGGNLYLLVEIGVKLAWPLHVADDKASLSFIGSDDPYLFRS